MTALGIIAGGGDLPKAIAESARDSGREIFVIGLAGCGDDWVNGVPHEWASLGEMGKVMKALHGAGCDEVVLAGKLARPKFSEVKLDGEALLAAPRIIAAARKGDDALLRAVVDTFAREGFKTVGAHEAAPGLLATEGPLGLYHRRQGLQCGRR
jgi:DUF1009 family protein